MAYISHKHLDDKADLVHALRIHIKSKGTIADAARKIKMDEHALANVLRLERSVSLSKLDEIGAKLGLRLVMKWEKKSG